MAYPPALSWKCRFTTILIALGSGRCRRWATTCVASWCATRAAQDCLSCTPGSPCTPVGARQVAVNGSPCSPYSPCRAEKAGCSPDEGKAIRRRRLGEGEAPAPRRRRIFAIACVPEAARGDVKACKKGPCPHDRPAAASALPPRCGARRFWPAAGGGLRNPVAAAWPLRSRATWRQRDDANPWLAIERSGPSHPRAG